MDQTSNQGSALSISVSVDPLANAETAKLNRQIQEVEHAPTR
jgi:hypothetical protein